MRVDDHRAFYAQVPTGDVLNDRLTSFIDLARTEVDQRPAPAETRVLDIGCGENAVLWRSLDRPVKYTAMDIKPSLKIELPEYICVDVQTDELSEKVAGRTFDVIFCGELIEHVFSPDRLLRQLRSILAPGGLLILSTPNLAYLPNRVLLLLGISPLFLENSSEEKLGRRFGFLGQGHSTEGHIRVFTHRAMLQLLAREGWKVERVTSSGVWNMPFDRLLNRSPFLAAVNTYSLRA